MSAACQQHRVARIDIVLEHFAPTVVLAQAQKVCRGLFDENVTKSVIKHSFLFKILDILEFTRKIDGSPVQKLPFITTKPQLSSPFFGNASTIANTSMHIVMDHPTGTATGSSGHINEIPLSNDCQNLPREGSQKEFRKSLAEPVKWTGACHIQPHFLRILAIAECLQV